MPDSDTIITYDNLGQPINIHIKFNGMWASVPYDPITKEFDETSVITKALRSWEKSNTKIDLSNKTPAVVPPNTLEKISKDTNIRNSKASEPQTVTPTRSPFTLDTNLQGNFNSFPYEIWDAKTSKIKPQAEGKVFIARVSFNSNALLKSVVFMIDLDVNGLVIYRHSSQPLQLVEGLLVETFTFFAGASFVQHGATLNISSNSEVDISNKSLYLIQLP